MPVIKLAFLDVGQGDTTIITCPDTHEAIVVDCVDSEATVDYLKREQITHLRGVIITHLHADHYKEVASLLGSYKKEKWALDCEVLAITEHIPNPNYLKEEKLPKQWPSDGDKHSTILEQSGVIYKSSLARLHRWCKENKHKCKLILADSNILLPIQGNIAQSLKVLHPTSVDLQDLRRNTLNNISIVLQITGTGASALLTGDLEPMGWQYLKDQNHDLKSDVLKFPHHGGAWGEAEADDLLSVVQPSVVAISVGSNNSYDHPHSDVFDAIQKRRDLRLLCTQATDKCQNLVQSERNNVIAQFQKQSEEDKFFFFPPKEKQCPCSGSIIVELRDKPFIIQPKTAFHESIINGHFKGHRCIIHSEPISVGIEAKANVFDD